MNVLLLSPYPEKLMDAIAATDSVVSTDAPVTLDFARERKIDLVVSYGYRHIIKEPFLSAYPRKIINLHVSFLPWNRGADPNFWSWYEQTPKGVSIHYIDSGIDTGPILLQREIEFTGAHTLDSSYALLKRSLENLFKENWGSLRVQGVTSRLQTSKGTFHSSKDKNDLFHLFPLGGQTPVEEVARTGKRRTL